MVNLHPKLIPRGITIFLHYFPGCDHVILSKKLHCRFESTLSTFSCILYQELEKMSGTQNI